MDTAHDPRLAKIEAELRRVHSDNGCAKLIFLDKVMGCAFESAVMANHWHYFAHFAFTNKNLVDFKGEIGGPFPDLASAMIALSAACGGPSLSTTTPGGN